jgi:hypothetical protein
MRAVSAALVFAVVLVSGGVGAFAAPLEEARPMPALIAPQTVNASFVQAAYVVVLNRTPSQAEVKFWLQPPSLTQTAVVQNLLNSNEFRVAAVSALYQHFLARPASAADAASGLTPAQVALEIVTSLEYYRKAGGTNEAFVAQLYGDALGRPATPHETVYWMQQFAAGASSARVAASVLQSPEGSSHLTLVLYQGAMHRSGTPSGPTLTSAALAAAQQMMR